MAFANDSYATVWEVEPVKDTITKVKITTRTKKSKDSVEFETDFTGYVSFVGTANAHKALSLHERDKIKLLKVAMKNKYDKDKKVMYWNPLVYEFELSDSATRAAKSEDPTCPQPTVDEGEVEDPRLPF